MSCLIQIKNYFWNQKSFSLIKACFFKFTLNKGGHKNCLGFLLGKECPDKKKLDVLKTAESGNFKTVNYIVIGRFLTILWRFSQQKRGE